MTPNATQAPLEPGDPGLEWLCLLDKQKGYWNLYLLITLENAFYFFLVNPQSIKKFDI